MSALPWCALCNRPVEGMLAWDDYSTMERVFTVRCHGATEQVRINRLDLSSGMTVEPGVAFGRREIARA